MASKKSSAKNAGSGRSRVITDVKFEKHIPIMSESGEPKFENGYEKIENGAMSDALGFNSGGFGTNTFGMPGTPGGSGSPEQLSDTTTLFTNLRWYFVSNMRQLLSELYVEIGLIRTICNVPVDDALRGGITVKSKQLDENEIKELQTSIKRDNDLGIVGQASKWERLFGGAGIIIIVDDQDPEDELDLDAIGPDTKVDFRAVDMWEIFWDKQNTEGYSMKLQTEEFEFYDYYASKVHKSRVLKFKGLDAPSFVRPRLRGWGLSVVEDTVRSINQYLKSADLTFEVLDEFKIDVYKMKNLVSTLLKAGGANKVKERVALANWQKNYQNAVIMDSEDDWDHKELSFAGLGECQAGIRKQVAADLRMPISKLFGSSENTGGLGNGEQNDMENYNSMVESSVRTPMEPNLLVIVQIKCQKLFGFIPDDLEIEHKPLRVLSAEQEENVKTQKFNRLATAKAAGDITTQEYRDACNKGNLFDIQLDTSIDNIEREDDPHIEDLLTRDPLEDGETDEGTEEEPNSDDSNSDSEDSRNVITTKNSFWRQLRKFVNGFDESKHPRADDGKFGKGGGGKGKGKKSKGGKSAPTIKSDKLVAAGDVGELLREHRDTFEKLGEDNPNLKTAVFEWSRAGYIYARALQQGKKHLDAEETQIGKEILKGLDDNFHDLPNFDGPISRDLQFDDWDQALDIFKPGNDFETDGYSSFTAKEGYSQRKCRLVVEKNTKGRAVWGLSQAKDEAEVIIPKGQKYKIDRVEQNEDGPPFVIVYLKESDE